MKLVAILSGKGGVGKTTLSASLSALFARDKRKIISVDTDVDAPNLLLIMNGKVIEERIVTASEKAVLDESACASCQQCVDVCPHEAIEWNEKDQLPVINSLLCEGCGICTLICPLNALKLEEFESGKLKHVLTPEGIPTVTGDLKIGEGSSGKIVSEAKEFATKIADKNGVDIMLIDGPPGTGCPVIATASGIHHAILITEPTPAAIHDLKRALELVRHFCQSVSLVINKANINKQHADELISYARQEGLVLLGRIPVSSDIPKSIVAGKPVVDFKPDSPASKAIEEIYSNLLTQLKSL
ncbi:MAG: P-loop NTPase [Candidatus Helarchaeales archaeon]